MAFNEKTVSDLADLLGMPEVLEQFRSTETPADGVNPLAEKIKGVQVFGQTQLDERITNERTAAALEAKNTAVGNTYGAMDKRIFTETGIAKNEGESTVDYMARAAKEKFGNPGNESEEMQRLRDDVKAKTELLTQKNTELEQLRVAHATEAKTLQINSRLDAAINALAIDAPADRLDGQREFVKFKLMQRYEVDVVEGKVVFKDKATGQIEKDSQTASPLSEAALIAKFAPSVVSVKVPSQKRGAGVDNSSHNQELDELAAYATIEDYKKALAAAGVTLASQDGQDKLQKYIDFRNAKK